MAPLRRRFLGKWWLWPSNFRKMQVSGVFAFLLKTKIFPAGWLSFDIPRLSSFSTDSTAALTYMRINKWLINELVTLCKTLCFNYIDSLLTFFQFSDIDLSKSTISDSPSESFPSSPGSSFKYFPSCDEEGMDSVSIVIISRLPSCNSLTAFTCSNNFVTESSDAEAKRKNWLYLQK